MKKSLLLLLVLVMALSAFLTGCTGGGDTTTTVAGGDTVDTTAPATTDEPSGTLTVGIVEAGGLFSPFYYTSSYDGYVVNMVFEGLTARNFEGEIVPRIAESWDFSDEGRTITFKIREGVKFSNGDPLTAEDVVFTYKVLAEPSYDGRFGSVVKDLKGYADYSSGKTTDFPGVVALDELTVQFNFAEALRTNLENCGVGIASSKVYGEGFEVGKLDKVKELTSKPVGAGPYVLEKYEEKQLVYLTRNMNYYGEGFKIKDIILKFVDQTTDIVELTSGAVDLLAGQVEPKKVAEARNNGLNVHEYNRSGYGYVKTNNQVGPTADKKVRQALYYSFNVQEFVDNYFQDPDTKQVTAITQYHPFSRVSWALDDAFLGELIEYKFDLEKAKALLDEAGWKVGPSGYREKDGEVFELKIAAMPDHDILNTLIPMWERDWGQGLNLKLTVAYLEFNTILDYVMYSSDDNVDKWSMFFLATSITSPDPHSLYSTFHSSEIGSGKNNTSLYSNPEVDKLFDDAMSILEVEKARPVYQKIAKILNEEAVMMPVYCNTYYDLYAPKLKNYKTGPLYDWVAALEDATVEE